MTPWRRLWRRWTRIAMTPREALEALYKLRAEALKTRPGHAEN